MDQSTKRRYVLLLKDCLRVIPDILYYGESLNSLCGILFISFFVHNIILPIVKSQRNPRPTDLGDRHVPLFSNQLGSFA